MDSPFSLQPLTAPHFSVSAIFLQTVPRRMSDNSSTPTTSETAQGTSSASPAPNSNRLRNLNLKPTEYIDPQCLCAIDVRTKCGREFVTAIYCHNRQVDMGRRQRIIPDLSICKRQFNMLFKCMDKYNVDFTSDLQPEGSSDSA